MRVEGSERGRRSWGNGRDYALDFVFYCAKGKLAVETDGDAWHGDRSRIPQDNLRDNDLETAGWKLLRFNTLQLNDAMVDYCCRLSSTISRLWAGWRKGEFTASRGSRRSLVFLTTKLAHYGRAVSSSETRCACVAAPEDGRTPKQRPRIGGRRSARV